MEEQVEEKKDIVKMGENFKKVNSVDLKNKIDTKKTGSTELTYLAWSEAWGEFVKIYPDATYKIEKNKDGLPYFKDESGAMVYVSVTANNLTHEMWLPIMDGTNKAMKDKPYIYQVNEYENGKRTGKMIDKNVEPFTMFDVNKTLMRCLTKCLAMFGLGLYIYKGEDMPEIEEEPIKYINNDQIQILEDLIKKIKKDGIRENFLIAFGIKDFKYMPVDKFVNATKRLNATIEAEKKEKGE